MSSVPKLSGILAICVQSPIILQLIASFLPCKEFIKNMRSVHRVLSELIIPDEIIKSIYRPLFENLFIRTKRVNNNWKLSPSDELVQIANLVKFSTLALMYDSPINNQRFNSGNSLVYHSFGPNSVEARLILINLFSIFTPGDKLENTDILFTDCRNIDVDFIDLIEKTLQEQFGHITKLFSYYEAYADEFSFEINSLYALLYKIAPEFVKRCYSDQIITCMWERCITASYLLEDSNGEPELWYYRINENRPLHIPEVVTSLKHDILEAAIGAESMREQLLDVFEFITMEHIAFITKCKSVSKAGKIRIAPRESACINNILQRIVAMSGYYYTTYPCGFRNDIFHQCINYALDINYMDIPEENLPEEL